VKKRNQKPAPKRSKKAVPDTEDIPQGVRDFLGPDHLHLFKRDNISAVLSQKPSRARSASEED